MDFNAKLIKIEEPQTGTSRNGKTWTRQSIILETESKYPKQICVTVWGDNVWTNPGLMQVGNRLNVSFELESREYNGRWYTDVRAWRIQEATMGAGTGYPEGMMQAEAVGAQQQQATRATQIAPAPFPAPSAPKNTPQDDDLPF